MKAVDMASPSETGGKKESTSGGSCAWSAPRPPALSTATTARATEPTIARINWTKSVSTTPQSPPRVEYASVTRLEAITLSHLPHPRVTSRILTIARITWALMIVWMMHEK